MIRLRFAVLLLAAGIVLVCGCISLSHHPLFSRLRGSSADCCDEAALPDGELPIGESGPVILPPPTAIPAPGGGQGLSPDRLEPVPASPRTPAAPSGRVKDSRQLQSLDKPN